MSRRNATKLATIANGATLSDAVACEGLDLVAVQFQAAFTGVALTFEASFDNVTFQPVYTDAGNAVSLTVAQARYVLVNTLVSQLRGLRFLKIKSGSAEGAARSVWLVFAER